MAGIDFTSSLQQVLDYARSIMLTLFHTDEFGHKPLTWK